MIHEWIYWTILLFIIADFAFEQWLDYLQYKTYDHPIPQKLSDVYSKETVEKQKAYHKEYYKFEFKHEILMFILTLTIFGSKFLGTLDLWLRMHIHKEFWITFAFFSIMIIVSFIIGLPFKYYETFVIEQKYGFNTTTHKTFIMDIIKSFMLGILIGTPLLWLIFQFYQSTLELFWLYSWLIIMVFVLFFNLFYTKLIVPIFNKLNPLPDGELKESILAFCNKVNFPLKEIAVMDASRRSTKGNAYFSGFGKNKRIVLFDTLLNQLTNDEIVAVLAHEIGHYKHKHIIKSLILGFLQIGLTLFILSLFIHSRELSLALGSNQASFHLGIIAFGILYTPFSTIISIFFNWLSRKNEFQADNFAAQNFSGMALISALKKLASANYSHLTPHPLFVKIHYSHPPLKERIEFIEQNSNYESMHH